MKTMVLVLFSLLSTTTFTLSQPMQASWDNLKQLRPGQKVEVVDAKMKTYNGKFASFTDEAITIHEGKTDVTVPRADIVRVSVRDNSHRTRNMLLGAAIGGGVAIAVTIVPLVSSSNEGNGCGICVAGIAAGFGGGTALGMIPGHRTIYRAQTPKHSASN